MANFNPEDYDDFYDDSPSQPPQKPPKKPMSTGKKIGIGCAVIAGVIILLLIIMFGCTATMIGSSTSDTDTKTESSDDSAKAENLSVGQTADNDGETVTLDSVTRYAGTEYSQPSEGMEFLVFNWSFANSSDKDFTPYSGMFDVYADGTAVQEYFGNTEAKSIGSQTLINGTKESGSVTYEVPVGWKEIQVRVVQDFWLDKDVTFTVKPDQVQ